MSTRNQHQVQWCCFLEMQKNTFLGHPNGHGKSDFFMSIDFVGVLIRWKGDLLMQSQVPVCQQWCRQLPIGGAIPQTASTNTQHLKSIFCPGGSYYWADGTLKGLGVVVCHSVPCALIFAHCMFLLSGWLGNAKPDTLTLPLPSCLGRWLAFCIGGLRWFCAITFCILYRWADDLSYDGFVLGFQWLKGGSLSPCDPGSWESLQSSHLFWKERI